MPEFSDIKLEINPPFFKTIEQDLSNRLFSWKEVKDNPRDKAICVT